MDNQVIEIPKKTIDRFLNAEKEWSSMLAFIKENSKDCDDRTMLPPKEIIIRYGLSYEWRSVGLAWYLLDQYFKGNIKINKDAQSEYYGFFCLHQYG